MNSDTFEWNFKLTTKQAECFRYLRDDIHTEIWYWGAAWWWKTRVWVSWVMFCCITYPWTRYFIWRKELTTLKKSTYQTYLDILADCWVPDELIPKVDWQNNIIKFWTGSQIHLLDLAYKPTDQDYHRFGSTEYTWWFVDEAAEVDQKAITILKTRIWRQKNELYDLKPKILLTFNPDKWHVYADFYRPRRDWTLPPFRVFIPAKATDNKYLSKNYLEQLEHADEVTRQRLLYWNFEYDETKWKVFRTDEILDMFTNNIEASNDPYISADVARLWDDKTIITVWKWLEAVEFIRMEKKTTDVIANKIKELEYRYKVPRRHIVIDTDWVWWWVADQLRWCYQFHNNARPIETEVDNNYWNLKAQCYFMLHFLAEKRLIKLNASWQDKDEICLELENILKKNPDKDWKILLESKEDMKKRLWDNSPDIADSIMMRMVFELDHSWPVKRYDAVFDSYE